MQLELHYYAGLNINRAPDKAPFFKQNFTTKNMCEVLIRTADIGRLKRNIKIKMPVVREEAYNTLVRSQLEYAVVIWDSHNKDKIISTHNILTLVLLNPDMP